MAQVLWSEYGIAADLSYHDVPRALHLHNLDQQRQANMARRGL